MPLPPAEAAACSCPVSLSPGSEPKRTVFTPEPRPTHAPSPHSGGRALGGSNPVGPAIALTAGIRNALAARAPSRNATCHEWMSGEVGRDRTRTPACIHLDDA